MITARSLRVRLGDRVVVDDISVALGRGELVAIVGRNAAGKTTLLRTLAGLLVPIAGSVEWAGRSPNRWSARERAHRVAYVAQRPTLSERFSVRDTIELGRYALRHEPRRIDEAILAFGLEAIAARPYHDLSVGQQQRVALARAWAQADPDGVFLLDEPFAAMDLAETDRAVRLLRAHVGQGGAAIVVVHDLTLAARCSDRVWLLADGRMAAQGPTREILAPSVLEEHFGVRFVSDADGVPIAQLGAGRERGERLS